MCFFCPQVRDYADQVCSKFSDDLYELTRSQAEQQAAALERVRDKRITRQLIELNNRLLDDVAELKQALGVEDDHD